MTRTGRPCAPTAVKQSRAWRRWVRRGWSSRACGSAPRARGTCPTSSTCREPPPPFVDAVWKRRRLRRGEGGELFWSASRMIFGGVEENIPRPFGPRKRRARSRREYRNAESHERFEFDARPRPRCGANTGAGTIVSTPGTLRRLGARCQISWKWDKWRKNRNTRRGSRAKGREAREPGTRVSIGLTNRTRGPRTGSIRSDVERARSAIARDGRARISTSRAAPVSPVFRGKTEENATGGLAGERA